MPPAMDLHLHCRPLADSEISSQNTKLDYYCFARCGLIFCQVWSLSLLAATVSTGKGESVEPVGRCSDGNQAAGCDGGYGERAPSGWL